MAKHDMHIHIAPQSPVWLYYITFLHCTDTVLSPHNSNLLTPHPNYAQRRSSVLIRCVD